MLWIELRIQFEKLCVDLPGNRDVLRRFWTYCGWCLHSKNQDISTAAALGFCEHLIDTPATREALPHLMSRTDFLGLKKLLLYHNSEEQFAAALAMFGK